MSSQTGPSEQVLREVVSDVDRLRGRIQTLHAQTGYEDLEHADLGLQIVHHAIEETLEHKGLGGHIQGTHDPEAHRQAEQWEEAVHRVRAEAGSFLGSHPSEDLETALKALEIAEGSLHETVEAYE